MFDALKCINVTTKNGARVFFDENGDSIAKYDLVNWQMKEDGSADIFIIGQFDNSSPEGKKLKLKEYAKIVWGGYNNVVTMQNFVTILDNLNIFNLLLSFLHPV